MVSNETIQKELKQIDIYRDSPIRFLGYANEVGEAFRAIVPVSLVRLSYVIASGYVCADTFDKSHKASKHQFVTPGERRKQVVITAGDTLLWQSLASVIIPGFTINRLCAFSSFILKRSTRLGPPMVKAVTTGIGLSAIPLIIKPIDVLVELGMDTYVRKYYSYKTPDLVKNE
ncbi:hypothetical protein FO519_008838 [Halicephalobus sp. NKZ332]|nr:hypothetical protein FO519_008838 [Halicephalobus sp. NKZ332]